MAKEVKANLKLKIKGGQASAAPPVGSTLGQYGVNMMDFIQPFNDATKDMMGQDVTAHITIYDDRSMDFRIVSMPTDERIKSELGIKKGSGKPNSEKVTKKLTDEQLTKIATEKAKDMNTSDIDAVKKMVAGTARSMGVEIEKIIINNVGEQFVRLHYRRGNMTENNSSEETSKINLDENVNTENTTAKSGKRSAKSIKEAEEKIAKQEKKLNETAEETKPKIKITPTRSKLERRSKQYKKSFALLPQKDGATEISKAIDLIKKTSFVKFDATVELHVNLGVDPRHADQNIRDTLVLPAGTGKKVKIAVFSDEAKESGADITGVDEISALLDKGNIDFDVLISTPNLMPKLGKYARVLGPRGLMPNPKSGTVTTDINKAVKESKSGKIEYRVDSAGIVHVAIGKVSFDNDKLLENFNAVLKSLKAAKPSSVKGTYIKNMHLSTSMGPSIQIDTSSLS